MQQHSGLAGLAGVSLPAGEEASRAQLGIALMTSRGFIGDFVNRRNILPELMAAESWDLSDDKVVFDSDIYEADSGEWVRDVDPPFKPTPSMLEAYEAFEEILVVAQDKKTGFVSGSIDHKSPTLAAKWVNWLVEDVNDAVKAQDVSEAEKSIQYLREQVTNTSLADLQAVFFDLIQSQTERVMLAEVRQEYVFKTIDPAIPPERKSKPQRVLICIVGIAFWIVVVCVVNLISHYLRKKVDD